MQETNISTRKNVRDDKEGKEIVKEKEKKNEYAAGVEAQEVGRYFSSRRAPVNYRSRGKFSSARASNYKLQLGT